MRYRFVGIAVLPVLVALIAATTLEPAHSSTSTARSDPNGLTAHEWGTFTSIADRDGAAIDWLPQGGPADLPCFVYRLESGPKTSLVGTVRMETPVLYFYSPTPTNVSVKVRFPKGAISEWYPKATVTPKSLDYVTFKRPDFEGRIAWSGVSIAVGTNDAFPTEAGKNHYYAARATDAAPIAVGSEREKFLFYRGVARFEPPIRAIARADGTVDVESIARLPLGDLVLFENRGGEISFRTARVSHSRVTLAPPSPRESLDTLYASLEQVLVDQGLYPREAAAMVDTWRDSWFEEGTRLLYLVPKHSVDEILPLEINPKPQTVTRVFVGRVELMTPRTLDDVKRAVQRRDAATMVKYGRFFSPIVDRITADMTPADRPVFANQLRSSWAAFQWNTKTCRQD